MPESNLQPVQALAAGDSIEVGLQGPLLCPYFNRWGESVYRQAQAFEHRPLRVPASSTSGSPVIQDAAGRFVGLLGFDWNQADDIVFRYDGNGRLTLRNDGDRPAEIFIADTPDEPDAHWRRYNALLAQRLPARSDEPAFWADPEYCTWVEQKLEAKRRRPGVTPHHVISADFIDRYLDDIARLDLPPGKLTIDHGWQHGDETYGDWDAHPDRFDDLGRAADRIRHAGFTPGIWLAPIWLHPRSRVAQADPSLLGEPIAPANADSPINDHWHYWQPGQAMAERMRELFGGLYRMGFRKFKLDMLYARKDLMTELQSIVYRSIKAVAPDAEVETHHPDPFFAVHTDTVRTNDVLCNDKQQWRELTRDHFSICERSAFDRIINLDHIGGNDPAVTEDDFLEHLGLYRDAVGYPVVSLLPHHVGDRATEATRALLNDYRQRGRARSAFVAEA